MGSAWSIFKDRFGTLVGIAFIIALPQYLPAAAPYFALPLQQVGLGTLLFTFLFSALYIIIFVFIFLWGTVALLYAIKDREEHIGILE